MFSSVVSIRRLLKKLPCIVVLSSEDVTSKLSWLEINHLRSHSPLR